MLKTSVGQKAFRSGELDFGTNQGVRPVCMCFCRSGSSEYAIHTFSFFILNRTKQDYNLSNHDFKSTLQLSTPTQYSNSRSCVVKGKCVDGRRGWHVTSRGGDWAYHTIGNPYLHNKAKATCSFPAFKEAATRITMTF